MIKVSFVNRRNVLKDLPPQQHYVQLSGTVLTLKHRVYHCRFRYLGHSYSNIKLWPKRLSPEFKDMKGNYNIIQLIFDIIPLPYAGQAQKCTFTPKRCRCNGIAEHCRRKTCSRFLHSRQIGIITCDLPDAKHWTYNWATTPHANCLREKLFRHILYLSSWGFPRVFTLHGESMPLLNRPMTTGNGSTPKDAQ